MWFTVNNMYPRCMVLIFIMVVYNCGAISNDNFNAHIRDYSVADHLNITDVKTLQKHSLGLGRYASFAPVQNVVRFKDVPDNAISESSHGRRLLHHDHGYGFEYENPHYGYEYKPQEPDHHDHDHHFYDFHDDGHHHPPGPHHGYGHHHKYYDHGLATKALLWPIAGIALLGAAAALVSNPVLLQLGVVSGKRRRRHVEEIENIARGSIKKWSQPSARNEGKKNDNDPHAIMMKSMLRKDHLKQVKRVQQYEDTSAHYERVKTYPTKHTEEDHRFIPIPLRINKT